MSRGYTPNPQHGSVFLGLAVTMLVASGCLVAGYVMLAADRAVPQAEAAQASEASPKALASAGRPAGDSPDKKNAVTSPDSGGRALTLHAPGRTVTVPWSELGARKGPDGTPSLDRQAARDGLASLAERYNDPPTDARLDLEKRVVHPAHNGKSIDILAALVSLEEALQSGATELELPTVAIPAALTVADLGIEDISHVLATFKTDFSVSDEIRNYNLQLAGSKLDGFVLKPGVEFSFNESVGDRTEKEGYKIAHVITAGEMVDGLAGGTCQISTTLHGAAFFAGLGIVDSTPHSRPSTYATMGLDATVVYPTTDLKLRNDYDFPVVIHYKVAQGSVVVEILGKERPYDKIVFERTTIEKLDFDTITREDDSMPVGTMQVDQYGFYGYKVDRFRKFYKDSKMVKRDRWHLRYAPVTEYARLGINPDPNLVPPKPNSKDHKKRLKEPNVRTYRLSQ